MLRRLDCDRIVDSGFWIRPKIRCDLRRAAERNQNAVRNVAFGEAEFLRAGTIDFQLQLRRARHLVHANIDRAGNLFQAPLDLTRDPVVLWRVSGNLNIDRRGESEIQDLADDVGRLKIETQIWKS